MTNVPFCACPGCQFCSDALNGARQERNDTRIERDAAVDRAARAEAEVLLLKRQVDRLLKERDRLLTQPSNVPSLKSLRPAMVDVLRTELSTLLGVSVPDAKLQHATGNLLQLVATHLDEEMERAA
jgi:hypothetical protein